jgi:cytochrome c551
MRLSKLFILSALLSASLAAPAANAGVVQGRKAWLKYNCYGCHGDNAGGGMGPNIRHADSGDVREAMTGGAREGGMRSFVGIAAPLDYLDITAYLATIGTKNEPTWHDWWKR